MCQELPGGEYADFITLKGGINYENINYKIPPYLPLPNPESFRDSLVKRG
jgi:hypothetical protein